MRAFFAKCLTFAGAGVIIATFLAYVAPWINPASFSWLSFFGTAFPWFVGANLILFAWQAWKRSRYAFYHLLILLFGWQYITAFFGVNSAGDRPDHAIWVATHNLGGLWKTGTATDQQYEQKAAAYARFLSEKGSPDILCTQETSGKFYRLLADKMGYEHTLNLKKGTVVLSRYPIENSGDIPFGKTGNSSLWADIRLPSGKMIRVYNVHLQSNKVTPDAEKIISDAELDEEKTWSDIRRVLGKVGRATGIRVEQAQRLRDHMNQCPHPYVVCGDFNDTPNSYVYRLLCEGNRDTFREKGFGWGSTFAGVLPFLRIDYVLTDPEIRIYDCRTRRGPFSDHYPVFAALGLK